MKPELKTAADQDALWEALDAGVVDVIESDHAPHTIAEKQAATPPYGVPGLETTLPLLGLAVHQGRLDAGQIPFLVAEKPRTIFGLQAPPETYTILDLDVPDIIDRQNLHTQCGWSPFEGMQVFGKVREVWIRGQQVFDGEAVLVEPGYGRNVVT
jgi:dihydroorotase